MIRKVCLIIFVTFNLFCSEAPKDVIKNIKKEITKIIGENYVAYKYCFAEGITVTERYLIKNENNNTLSWSYRAGILKFVTFNQLTENQAEENFHKLEKTFNNLSVNSETTEICILPITNGKIENFGKNKKFLYLTRKI